MRVCFRKSDNRIIEAQSGDHASLDVLKANAKSSGYDLPEIDARYVPDDEFEQLLDSQMQSDATSFPIAVDQQTDNLIASLTKVGVINSKQADAVRTALIETEQTKRISRAKG